MGWAPLFMVLGIGTAAAVAAAASAKNRRPPPGPGPGPGGPPRPSPLPHPTPPPGPPPGGPASPYALDANMPQALRDQVYAALAGDVLLCFAARPGPQQVLPLQQFHRATPPRPLGPALQGQRRAVNDGLSR